MPRTSLEEALLRDTDAPPTPAAQAPAERGQPAFSGALADALSRMPEPIADGDTPEQPIQTDGGSLLERAAASVGDRRGTLAMLRKQYEAAAVTKDGKYSVKQGGKWHAFDPEGNGTGGVLSQAAEFGKDVLGDGAALVAPTVLGVAGSLAGPGGPVLSFIGSLTGSGINHLAGKALGSYDPTPEELSSAAAWDVAINALGAAAPAVAKPGVAALGNLLTKAAQTRAGTLVVQTAKGAAGGIRDTVDGLLTTMAQLKPGYFKEATETPEMAALVRSELRRFISDAGVAKTEDEIKAAGIRAVMNEARPLVTNAQKNLSAQFDAAEKTLFSKAPPTFSVNLQETTRPLMEDLVKKGLVKPVVDKAGNLLRYDTVTLKEFAGATVGSANSPLLAESALKNMRSFVDVANLAIKKPTATGADAVKQLLQARRAFEGTYHRLVDRVPGMSEVFGQSVRDFRNTVATAFGKRAAVGEAPTLGSMYDAMNRLYVEGLPAVARAESISATYGAEAGTKGLENLAQQFLKGPAANQADKQVVEALATLAGKSGDAALKNMRAQRLAMELVPKFPHLKAKVAAAATAAVTGHPLVAGTALASIPLNSPRIVGDARLAASGKALKFMTPLVKQMRGLTTEMRAAMEKHPEIFEGMVKATFNAISQQPQARDAVIEKLLQNSSGGGNDAAGQ